MSSAKATRVLQLLKEREETLATAESLTGGLVASLLVGAPGASQAYVGGAVTYATRLKATLAGVAQETLDELGPVAARTAMEMASGVAERCGADWGLSTTGVAGPDSQGGHPVGQVFVAVAQPERSLLRVAELRLPGSRTEIRAGAAEGALTLLIEVLGMEAARLRVEDID